MNVFLAQNIDQEKWNEFVGSYNGSFLQSWEWGVFKERFGQRVWRIVVEEEGEWQGVMLAIRHDLPLGQCWIYVPRGPVVKNPNDQFPMTNLTNELIRIAREEGVVFVRVEPVGEEGAEVNERLFNEKLGWKVSENAVQPRETLVLELTKSEEELLAEMHQKTRYNIRLAEKRGVIVRFTTDEQAVDDFLALAGEVQGKGNFHYHPEDYYRLMREVLSPTGILELAVAEYQGQVLAVHWLIYFGDRVTYAHGASSNNHRAVMAPHLLQWQSIKRAKERGYKKYDFYGVAPVEAGGDHPWRGITRFKEGFGGERVRYLPARDLVLRSGVKTLMNLVKRWRGQVV